MALKRKKIEPEFIFVKVLFALAGAVLGAIFAILIVGRYYWHLKLSRETQLVIVLLIALLGAIWGYLWASKEVWSD